MYIRSDSQECLEKLSVYESHSFLFLPAPFSLYSTGYNFLTSKFKGGKFENRMDIISQLQEQVNTIAALAFNTFGTLQRDAPPVRLSPNYPEPPPIPTLTEDTPNISDQPKLMSAALVKAAKQFDVLVAALPLSEGGEEAQLKRIAELQAENDTVGQELQKQLEAAEKELKQVQELFSQAADNCLNLKKPD
ncbi:hypothetical protein VitviT2T_014634 [Vitis vinifera]|uniref:Mediator of RNA polymerase II transcription subunit 21 n=2 Tax=Vitis vinifera TaxID=29760 RepID=A0ABY9CKZ6_VITVI|nr:hypothetical protein VitviT2T_014634 [Vitis vinifera]